MKLMVGGKRTVVGGFGTLKGEVGVELDHGVAWLDGVIGIDLDFVVFLGEGEKRNNAESAEGTKNKTAGNKKASWHRTIRINDKSFGDQTTDSVDSDESTDTPATRNIRACTD